MRCLLICFRSITIINNPVIWYYLLIKSYHENNGYDITGAVWINIPNSLAFPDLFADALKYRTNYDYNRVNKSATMLVLDVAQILENRATKEGND